MLWELVYLFNQLYKLNTLNKENPIITERIESE